MGKKAKWLARSVALAVLLFAGPALSAARAGGVYGPGYYPHARPYHRRLVRPHIRPYRYARVFVFAPFPHWVYRPVYYAPPAYPYCRPY